MSVTITIIYKGEREHVLELVFAALAVDLVEMSHDSLVERIDCFGDFVNVRVTVYYFLPQSIPHFRNFFGIPLVFFRYVFFLLSSVSSTSGVAPLGY